MYALFRAGMLPAVLMIGLAACGGSGGGGEKMPDTPPPSADTTLDWDDASWDEKDWQ
jgi:hypothetical protein